MASITLNHIVKTFDDGITVIPDLNLEIKDKEFVIFVGPSGCGKSTTLRMIAGLEDISSGELIIGGKTVNNMPSKDRDIAMVFQSYALYPHMTVYKNMAFALKLRKEPKDVIDKKVREVAKILELEPYLNRKPKALSGGQRQRVALGRAMVRSPSVFLLDEPLSNLDAKLRTQMRSQIALLHKRLETTFIYVTHDQEEALTMSDKIVIMKSGEIQQVGTPQEIYNEPVNKYVANFIGESNVISGVMIEDYKVKFDDQIFDCVDFGFKPNEKVDVVLRPEDIDIVPLEQGKITGEVLSVLFKGVWNEAMVETVPGTTVKVNMNVIKNHDVESEYSDERISANDFYVDIEEVASLDDNDIIARADAQAWKESDDSYISISKIEHDLKEELGEYTVTFQTSSGLSTTRKIIVVDQKYVRNEKANEAVSAFNFFKTVDDIKESVALDTDLKTWANAIGWKLSNEDEAVDIYVDYDFDPENIQEGIYQVTFSTEGRELKVHTTDYVEEGQEVGLTFEVEDIHVMEKMGF